jgi:DMSO reductase anchor subunit
MVPKDRPRSYYGRPVIKPPVWKPQVPWYLFVGGLAGASAPLALMADVTGNRKLGRNAGLITLAAGTVSPALLITDLGRPERFLNMMRVFKVTSPMSVGSWILAGTGTTAAAATAHELLGVFPRLGRTARALSALFGVSLATYTGALLSNTAVPAWHEARRELPFVFAGSAAASAGAAAAIVTAPTEAGPARRLAVIGVTLEVASVLRLENRLGLLVEPYEAGRAGTYAKLAKGLSAAGAALIAIKGRRREVAVPAGTMVLAGSAFERWAIFKAGVQSALDPKYTVEPQRARLEARGEALVDGHS